MTAPHRATLATSFAWLLVVCAACDAPPVDAFRGDGGTAPDPTGVLDGTVVYVGPRPRCTRDASGMPTGIAGNVVLLLFDFANPPPPEGAATSAVDLLAIPGPALFDDLATDCLPASPTPADLAMPITRSAPFTWPDVALGRTYTVRGFYDAGGDFVPFFSVRNLPSEGDVVGGAFVDVTATPRRFARIAFDSASARPLGQRVSGVTVTLAGYVNTERPLFRPGGDRRLSSQTTMPLVPPAMLEQALFDQTRTTLDLLPGDAPTAAALAAAGLAAFDTGPLAYAWYVEPVDANDDGMPDMHPLLGGLGVFWTTPILLLERARTPAEVRSGIPDVLLIASTRGSEVATKTVWRPSIDMVVPPIGLMVLDAGNPACRVPIVPPGNVISFYAAAPADCQELPTGEYSLDVLHGVAGATPGPAMPPSSSDTGFALAGGTYSSQAWSIPNELGPPDLVYDPLAQPQLPTSVEVPEQGPDGRFRIFDADTTNNSGHEGGVRAPGCTMALDPMTMMPVPVVIPPVPPACCTPAVTRLCGLPLCPPTTLDPRAGVTGETPSQVRRVDDAHTTANADGSSTPTCVPFQMPASCCGGT